MAYAQHGGKNIYYTKTGAGPALIFLHGGGSNATGWYQQVAHFSSSYTCLFIDSQNFGRSHPLDFADLSLSGLADDITAVLDVEGIESFAIIGHSMGAASGLRAVMKHPNRVWAFAASSSPMGIANPKFAMDAMALAKEAMETGQQIEDAALSEVFRQNNPNGFWLYRELNQFNQFVSRGAELGLDIRQMVAKMFDPTEAIPPENLAGIKTPVLCMGGALDRLVLPSSTEAIAGYFTGAELKIFDECGHSPYFEIPDQYNEVVEAFLDKHRPKLSN